MPSDVADPPRWGQAVALALLGIGVLLIPRTPSDALGLVTAQLLPALLLWSVLRNSANALLGLTNLPRVWHAAVALALGGPTAFAISAGIRARSWTAARHGFLEFLPIMLGIALATAIPSRESAQPPGTPPQHAVRALRRALLVVAMFAMLMGFEVSQPDAQETLGGVTWAWRRGLLVAAFTAVALGVLVVRHWRSRPAA